MANSDVAIGLCRALRAEPRYFANGDGDELYFVQEGAGRIESLFGVLAYKPGDYLLIPRGTIYRMVPDAGPDGTASSLLLFIEGRTYLEIPQNFRNGHGMLRMDAMREVLQELNGRVVRADRDIADIKLGHRRLGNVQNINHRRR